MQRLGLRLLRAPGPTCAAATAALLLLIAPHASDARASRPVFHFGGNYPSETAYSLALHMHGSMSEQSGSWEWHTQKAESIGVDIIWWTDHDWRLMNDRAMKRYDFEHAFWDAPNSRWSEADEGGYPEGYRYWDVNFVTSDFLVTSVVDSLAYQSKNSLRLEGRGSYRRSFGAGFATGYITQTCSNFQNYYSLAKRVHLRFHVFPEQLDPANSRFVVEVELSDHPEGTHILRYVMGSTEDEGVHTIPLSFTPHVWNDYDLDITSDAIANFSNGGADSLRIEDNALAFVRLGMECRNAANAVVFFDEYRIDPDPSMVGNTLADRARAIGAYYETLYPAVRHYIGSEISLFRGQPHLNAFAPHFRLVDYAGHSWSDSLYYAIDQIHAQGGAVSLNHVFGSQYTYQDDPDETDQERAARIAYTKQGYIGCRALGVDVWEVGYRRRGGCNLAEHLSIWDALSANMIFLTGDGVTDSHGRGASQLIGWGPSEAGLSTTNNFVTWLFTEDLSEAGFVHAMKAGRAYFGDPYRWNGGLDLRTVDGFRMGQVVLTDRPSHDVLVTVTNVAPDVEVRLLQAEMQDCPPQPYLDPVWLRDETLTASVVDGVFQDTVSVSTQGPSFARVEVRDGQGREMVYSNPLYFVRAVPRAGVEPERVAARLGPTRVYLAEDFRLQDASYDPNALVLHLAGAESPPGLGRITIDPGALGTPRQVAGATSWSFVNGVLELTGFSGPTSSVYIRWGDAGTGTPPLERPSRLGLDPGRPNPFGRGTAIDYTLPRDGWVRLEVLDTTGRRVRVLALEFEKEGAHRASWDGKDEGGKDVAAGIYYIRLQHDGKMLVQKAARLR